jgi:hypothetical protein
VKRPPAEIRATLDRCPRCRWCKKPVVAGQVDAEGVPAHYVCQIAFLARRKPHPREVPINPKLPQAQHFSRERTAP